MKVRAVAFCAVVAVAAALLPAGAHAAVVPLPNSCQSVNPGTSCPFTFTGNPIRLTARAVGAGDTCVFCLPPPCGSGACAFYYCVVVRNTLDGTGRCGRAFVEGSLDTKIDVAFASVGDVLTCDGHPYAIGRGAAALEFSCASQAQ